MKELIKQHIPNERLNGIIPVEPKGLRMQFANKAFTPGIGTWLIIFIVSLVPAAFLTAFLGFILTEFGMSELGLIGLFVLLLGLAMAIGKRIYVSSSTAKYPETLLAITDKHLHFFAFNNGRKQYSHTFNASPNNFGEIFYGQAGKSANTLGKQFQIRENNKILLSGKLSLKNKKLYSAAINESDLFPSENLVEIIRS